MGGTTTSREVVEKALSLLDGTINDLFSLKKEINFYRRHHDPDLVREVIQILLSRNDSVPLRVRVEFMGDQVIESEIEEG